ncbi:MAG: tRNA (adenosine(37)-N6)-threonylcarbamoyltransferase complex dimerization subunit type 1 TsaB [Proteobacteria bacterium]|nr:tRNA (adenosine(37)-N6)-threonylcarbamoyltransferase complex dimerization subunit type 1 TsaB [Pseudomonadota bacterium]
MPLQTSLILAIDAASSRCSVVLWEDRADEIAGRVVAFVEHEGQSGDAARLPRMVAGLLADQALRVADLLAVAVAVGPGSFTGLRASLAFAEGLSAGAGLAVIGVTVAEALAAEVDAAEAAGSPIWCALDARQGRLFLHRGGAPEEWEVARLDAPPRPETPVALTGDAAVALGAAWQAVGVPARVTAARHSHARGVAVVGAARLRGLLPPLAARPLYIDPPRALLPKGGLRPPPALARSAS